MQSCTLTQERILHKYDCPSLLFLFSHPKAFRLIETFQKTSSIYDHLYSHLYIYPRKVSNLRLKHGGRNCISVEVRDDDTSVSVEPLPLIYGMAIQNEKVRTGTLSNLGHHSSHANYPSFFFLTSHSFFFLTTARTALVSDAKPEFFEEFKIELPLTPSPKLHLFFTIYSVGGTSSSSKKKDSVVAGYAVLRLSEVLSFPLSRVLLLTISLAKSLSHHG